MGERNLVHCYTTCLWEAGTRDSLIDPQRADDALVRIRRAYQALDASERLLLDRFEGGHVWNGKAAYPLLDKVLLKKSG